MGKPYGWIDRGTEFGGCALARDDTADHLWKAYEGRPPKYDTYAMRRDVYWITRVYVYNHEPPVRWATEADFRALCHERIIYG
jgi:hypothetical protein